MGFWGFGVSNVVVWSRNMDCERRDGTRTAKMLQNMGEKHVKDDKMAHKETPDLVQTIGKAAED